ncbi:uncharacterized protein LOC132187972 [Corylus avellana]|uniref:uncharacterized protein LOC132187972 n=1 Tax=Corylus avellana TaxID=13451 RepID=UPI00286A8418|nr:uncharacterized protein LOC132187972 [Corylus avellana]
MVGNSSSPTHRQEHMQAIVTLRSERQVDNQVVEQEEDPAGQEREKSGNKEKRDAEPSIATPIIEDPLRSFDLITVKRKTNVPKKAFLTKQVSSILQCKLPLKYKDPGCPTISCMIGVSQIERALLDLGASVNLLPYSVYVQLGLGELRPTSMTLQLADRSVKVPRGIVEDVLIKVDKFYFPVDFIVLDTEPVPNVGSQIPVCLIEEILEDVVEESSMADLLDVCFAQFGEDLDLDKLLEQADAILETAPLVSSEKEETTIPDPPKKELKPLPDTLKYKFLGLANSLSVIIALDLVDAQEEKLLEVLREHKEAIG